MTAVKRAGRRRAASGMIAAVGPWMWKLLAGMFIVMGVIGLLLPVVPTVPFLLLAAGAASRGWPWLHDRLHAHPTYGPMIRHWHEHRAIPRRGKWAATIGMIGSSIMLWVVPEVPLWVRIAVPLVMAAVGWWIWRRPDV